MSIFNATDHRRLAALFQGENVQWSERGGCYYKLHDEEIRPYAGYRPTVREVPNGDGKADEEKRYLHVALKYKPPAWAVEYLARAHFEACKVAESLGVPAEFYPRVADGTLRVLEYPAGAGSTEHTDFDLFTLNCWRSTPEDHEQFESRGGKLDWYAGASDWHVGELAELVMPLRATPHRVPARAYGQRSIVYFAMPPHSARLPCTDPACDDIGHPGRTVGEWLKERISRSRVYA